MSEKQEDLTERSLTNLLRKYFQDENLNVEIRVEDQQFLDANDNFSSDTRKLHLRITNASRFNGETSIIVKASLNRQVTCQLYCILHICIYINIS